MNGEFTFLINRNSGSGKSSKNAQDALISLADSKVKSTLPESPDDLTRICAELDPDLIKAAVVFGGDGTQSYAVRGLIESGIPLYPFPSGTANDLASEQGITGCLVQFRDLIQKQSTEEIRVLSVNDVPFSTVAGIGIGSRICEDYNRLRNHFPIFKKVSQRMNCEIYSLLAVKQILRQWGKGMKIRVQADDFNRELTISSLMICNQSTLAGNLEVAPGQNHDDDQFTVLIHPEACGFSTLQGLALLRKKSTNAPFIRFKTRSLKIESLDGHPLTVFGDGEILTSSSQLTFQEHPKKLKVFTT
jgi:diacylglycerol kinase family enzyme